MPVRFLSEAQREHLSTFPAERDPAPPVTKAVAWYARSGRIVVGRDRDGAIDAVVAGWAGDVAQGHQSAMNAWRRADVAELNRRARQEWRRLGRLQGEDLVAPGGTPYAVGDRVVTWRPAPAERP